MILRIPHLTQPNLTTSRIYVLPPLGVKPDLVETLLVGHFWSAKFGPAHLVRPIFGPTHIWSGTIFGPSHIWSNQIWSVPYLVQPNLVRAIFGPSKISGFQCSKTNLYLVHAKSIQSAHYLSKAKERTMNYIGTSLNKDLMLPCSWESKGLAKGA